MPTSERTGFRGVNQRSSSGEGVTAGSVSRRGSDKIRTSGPPPVSFGESGIGSLRLDRMDFECETYAGRPAGRT